MQGQGEWSILVDSKLSGIETKMNRIRFICFLILTSNGLLYSQLPNCGVGYFYQSGISGGCIAYALGGSHTPSVGISLGAGCQGLAVGPNLGFPAPDPTYWSVGPYGNYYYYNGTTWVNTGHSAGGAGFVNPGAGQNVIYNINSSGQISVYNGTANASILTTLNNFSSADAVSDIVADNNDNFYLLKSSSPQCLAVFNPQGVMTCSYSIQNLSGLGSGLGITNNKVIVLGSTYLAGSVVGGTISFVPFLMVAWCLPNDLAVCPSDVRLFPEITALPTKTITCIAPNLTLTSNDAQAMNSYTWSGPGILSGVNSHSIVVNAAGTYSRLTFNCVGQVETRTFVVSSNLNPSLTVSASSTVMCEGQAPVTITVGGLANYTWTPATSLSSPFGSTVAASPSLTTNYTVQASINGCNVSTVFTIYANPIPEMSITASSQSICSGSNATLSVAGSLNYLWFPGVLVGPSVTVAPLVLTTYTLLGFDNLNCTKTATLSVDVVDQPTLSVSVSTPSVCEGNPAFINASGATMYLYQPGNLSGASVTVSPLISTVFTVSGSNWNCVDTETVLLTVEALPPTAISGNQTLVCIGESVILQGNGASSYLWSTNETGSSIVVSPLVNTIYSLTGTNQNGCSRSATYTLEVSECTGVTSLEKEITYMIYPNPTDGLLNVLSSEPLTEASLILLNSSGQLVHKQDLDGSSAQVNFRNCSPGLYQLQIKRGGTTVFTGRVVFN